MIGKAILLFPLLLLAACAQTQTAHNPTAMKVADLIQTPSGKADAQYRIKQITDLMDLITASIDPTSWHSVKYPNAADPHILYPDANGSMAISGDTLLVTQSPENLSEVASLLAILRQDRSLQVFIEAHFMLVDPHLLDGMDPAPAAHDVVLDAFTTRLLLHEVQANKTSNSVLSARVTLIAGQTVNIEIPPIENRPAAGTGSSTPRLTITANVSADRHVMRFHIVGSPFPSDIALPDGKSLLLRTGQISPHPAGTQPVDNRILLILLRPKILTSHEIEMDRFGHTYEASTTIVSAGAPQPAK